jgi:hypothetical protein
MHSSRFIASADAAAKSVNGLRGLQMVKVCFRAQTLNHLDQEVKHKLLLKYLKVLCM